MIGFAGAHRTGKTTLAKIIAERTGYQFLETNIQDCPVWKKSRIRPCDYVTFSERMCIQSNLLDYLISKYEKEIEDKEKVVVDRTPLDIIGYLFSNLDNTCSDLWSTATGLIIDRAITVSKMFKKIFLVQPGIPLKSDDSKEGKFYSSKIFRTALNNNILAFGYLNLGENFVVIPRELVSIEDRVNFIKLHI